MLTAGYANLRMLLGINYSAFFFYYTFEESLQEQRKFVRSWGKVGTIARPLSPNQGLGIGALGAFQFFEMFPGILDVDQRRC